MGVFLVILIVVLLCWPAIQRWLARYAARRAEDYLRRATGMPPRPDSRAGKKAQRERERAQSRTRRRQTNTRGHRPVNATMQEYAEDVEFTETVSYSETVIGGQTDSVKEKEYRESQVTDAEWTEVRGSGERRRRS